MEQLTTTYRRSLSGLFSSKPQWCQSGDLRLHMGTNLSDLSLQSLRQVGRWLWWNNFRLRIGTSFSGWAGWNSGTIELYMGTGAM